MQKADSIVLYRQRVQVWDSQAQCTMVATKVDQLVASCPLRFCDAKNGDMQGNEGRDLFLAQPVLFLKIRFYIILYLKNTLHNTNHTNNISTLCYINTFLLHPSLHL